MSNLSRAIRMAASQTAFNISSRNDDRVAEGIIFVLHAQLEPLSAGCNIGDMDVVTKRV